MSDSKFGRGFIYILLTAACSAVICHPGQAAQAVREGLTLCGTVMIPSLFPFLILSSLVVDLGLSQVIGKLLAPLMRPLFRVGGPCSAALVLGLLGGYPTGARTALRLYETGQCSECEAMRLLGFCSNCGPAFILGVVGGSVFGSRQVGLMLWAVHGAAALLIGLLFRFYPDKENHLSPIPQNSVSLPRSFSDAFLRAVTGALQSCFAICSFVLCFSVLIRLLPLAGAARLLARFGPDPVWTERLLAGVLEFSSGITRLTDGTMTLRLAAAAFLLGWGGLSVHLQTLALLSGNGLSPSTYLAGKLMHGLLSAGLVLLLRGLGLLPCSVFAPLTVPCSVSGAVGSAALSWCAALLVWLLLMLAVPCYMKNHGGKSVRNAL